MTNFYAMKPDRQTAMQLLIEEVRLCFPFDKPETEICAGTCIGCPKKLLELVDSDLSYWQSQLAQGNVPTLGEISRFAKMCRNIHRALKRNQLVS